MSAQLGIGVRVWVGWSPRPQPTIKHLHCRTGIIVEGPRIATPGVYIQDRLPVRVRATVRFWRVTLDGTDEHGWFAERILFPIDDGDPAAERERADRGEEVGA